MNRIPKEIPFLDPSLTDTSPVKKNISVIHLRNASISSFIPIDELNPTEQDKWNQIISPTH